MLLEAVHSKIEEISEKGRNPYANSSAGDALNREMTSLKEFETILSATFGSLNKTPSVIEYYYWISRVFMVLLSIPISISILYVLFF